MKIISFLKEKLRCTKGELAAYIVLYGVSGIIMNAVGKKLNIAQFMYDAQIISCYLLYMIPVSLAIRNETKVRQYLWGLLAIGLLEFGGYALGTSVILGMGTHTREMMEVKNNPIALAFGLENFALGMSLFFAVYFPLGNIGAAKIYSLFKKQKPQKDRLRKAAPQAAVRVSNRRSRK